MKLRLPVFLTILLTVLSPGVSQAQWEEAAEEASSLVREFMERTNAPGVAVSVGVRGQIVWSEGFGYADVEQRVPVWPSITRFRVGSVAKPMTAYAVAQLHQDGRIDIDAPIQRYVSSFPVKEEGMISTRMLGGHLAGIRHYQGDEIFSQRRYDTVLDGLTIFQNDPLLFEPGRQYSYSSYGFNLISAVVEGASGEEFLSFMDDEVFDPLGMNHTIADHVDRIISDRTAYYWVQDGELRNAPPVDNSYKWAGGGFLSTSEDIVRFGFAHLYPETLTPESLELLWTPQETVSGEPTTYGFGWSVNVYDGVRVLSHGGGSVGGTTRFVIIPDTETVIAIITNLSQAPYGDLVGEIADLFAAN